MAPLICPYNVLQLRERERDGWREGGKEGRREVDMKGGKEGGREMWKEGGTDRCEIRV